jgi:hypothetical protein
MPNTTIVSAFIQNINSREDRNKNEYIAYGAKLMNSNVPKILFLDKEIIASHNDIFQSNENTCIVPMDKSDVYMYQYIDKITNFQLRQHNPTKDTIEYILLQCNKTEFIREAIERNPFQTEQFIWVDFGIYHMFEGNDETYYFCLESCCSKIYENVRMPSLWNVYDTVFYNYNDVKIDIYMDVAWYFSGSVFGGKKDKLLRFSDLAKEKYVKIIEERGHIMWEINVWHLIWQDLKEKGEESLLDLYYGDHNYGILYYY